MALLTIRPTATDRAVANWIADATRPGIETAAEALTFAADERVMAGILALAWLGSRFGIAPQRCRANYLVANAAVSAVLPHLLKRIVDQQRPDRRVSAPRRGIPRSGKAYDAFPSGHAVHIGALASALSRLYPGRRRLVWSLGTAIATTRVVLLAHWLSDVVAGIAMGALVERTAWRWLGAGRNGEARRGVAFSYKDTNRT